MTSDDEPRDWRTPEQKAADIAQAKEMREKARKGGLRFEAYVPPDLAEWLLHFVEQGVFTDPSEAVFVILGEHKDLEPHEDLREEILKRSPEASLNDPRPSISSEELEEKMRHKLSQPLPEPAVWRKSSIAPK